MQDEESRCNACSVTFILFVTVEYRRIDYIMINYYISLSNSICHGRDYIKRGA